MRIDSREQRFRFFKENIKGFGSYAIANYGGAARAIWITRYENFNNEGDWFLEAPCQLVFSNLEANNPEHLEVIEEYGMIVFNGKVYEIESFQTSPFLPDVIDDIQLVDENGCLVWMLENYDKE